MNQKQENKEERFWSGYALGVFTAGIFAFALGTKTGRDKVKMLINAIEDDTKMEKFSNLMTDVFPEVIKNMAETELSDVNKVISKMKTISSDDNKSKKFISK